MGVKEAYTKGNEQMKIQLDTSLGAGVTQSLQ